jgi:protein O-mannosyl-transferase
MTGTESRFAKIGPILALAAAVLLTYWPVTGYDFIALDDRLYVLGNRHIQAGITAKGIAWAMTTLYTTNWHPLTWLSLMADYQWYGLNAGGYHLSSLLLHLLNTILLFLLLRRMTARAGRSFWVAALFAVHPLNIESVVWIAERKNLLSTCFWILTLLAYVRYAEKPEWGRYLLVVITFILGLMAKPMLVTLPFVLLLIDYWPLRRFPRKDEVCSGAIGHSGGWGSILNGPLMEKIPLLILSVLSALLTLYAAHSGGAVKSLAAFTIWGRITHALVSYVHYLFKMVWPADLAIYYPYPATQPAWQVAAALLLLSAITGFVLRQNRRFRYFPVGWFWYLITLFPVIGVVQVGFQSMANRYVYIPLVGIFIMVVWGIHELLKKWAGRPYLYVMAGMIILSLALSTRAQLPNWQNSEAAFAHALNVTQTNHIAQIGMGNVWFAKGEFQKAQQCYEESLRIKPDYPESHNNLGLIFMREGDVAQAEGQYREAVKDDPDYAEGYYNLGMALLSEGKFPEAMSCFRKAMELEPDYAEACNERLKELAEAVGSKR